MYSYYQVISKVDRCNAGTVFADGTIQGVSNQAKKCAIGRDLLRRHDDKGMVFHRFAKNLALGCPAQGWTILSGSMQILQ